MVIRLGPASDNASVPSAKKLVVDEPSGTKATSGANVAHVTVRFDARTETVLAIAAEDNLVKGASGQAIQAVNLLLGLPETTGLPLVGLLP